jgi:hypothetical protein
MDPSDASGDALRKCSGSACVWRGVGDSHASAGGDHPEEMKLLDDQGRTSE